MRRVVEGLLLVGLAVASGCGRQAGEPQVEGPSLTASIAPDSAGLGDPVELRIEAILPAGAVATFPGDADSIDGWTVLHAARPSEVGGSGDWRRWIRTVTIASFELGWIGPDSLRLSSVDAQGDSLRLSCAVPALYVGGEITPEMPADPSTAHDIRDVVSTGWPRWPWIAGGALLLLAAGLLLVRRLRARRRPAAAEVPPPGKSPEEEFEERIGRLLASGLLEEGRYREFYYEVSSAVRLYLERVHRLPLLESTSEELLRLLSPRVPDAAEREVLREWLREGDLVKYARMERLQAEALGYLERSRSLVTRLARPVVHAAPGSERSLPPPRDAEALP